MCRVIFRYFAVTLLLVSISLPATAAVSCNASLSNMIFGNVDPLGGNVDVSGTLSYGCSRNTILDGTLALFILVCIGIDDGTQGNGGINPRRMGNGGGNYLNFNLYSDIARTIIWGHAAQAFPPVEVIDTFALLGSTSVGGTRQVYGRIPSGQTTLVPGSYSNSFSGSVKWSTGVLPPSSCSSGTTSFGFSTQATVQSQCTVSASNLEFGTQGTLGSNVDATSSISVTCTSGTNYAVGLNNGSHFSSTRRMKNLLLNNYVNYEMYRDAPRSLRWGNTVTVDTQGSTGTGTLQAMTVYGRVPAQTSKPVGVYSDTITVTVTY